EEQARFELVESKKTLETQLGRPVRWFAYPFGDRQHFRPERYALVQEAGYDGCVSAFGGFVRQGATDPILPREAVPYFKNVHHLEGYRRGRVHWFSARRRRVGLLKPDSQPAAPFGRRACPPRATGPCGRHARRLAFCPERTFDAGL